MICKLCLQEKKLLKKSHLAPNFLYKELREEDNSFVKANLTDRSIKPIYTGLYEADILCQKCDNEVLGKLEDYAYKILYDIQKVKGVEIKREINKNGVNWTMAYGVDYKKFKLFLLSLIWRFSISKNEGYKFVNLGEHEEKIRKMILDGDPGDVLDYPCSITSYRMYSDLPIKIISQPLRHRNEHGGICYSFLMTGFLYIFFISKNLTPKYVYDLAINKNNELKVVDLLRENAVKIIKKHMGLPKNVVF